MISVVFIASIKAADDDASRDADNNDAIRAQAAVEADAQAAAEADAAAAGDDAAAALSSFASRAQEAVDFAPVLAFVPPSAAAAFVTSSSVTSSSVPASRIFFCGCSPSFVAAGADANAAGALGTPLLFPFLFLV